MQSLNQYAVRATPICQSVSPYKAVRNAAAGRSRKIWCLVFVHNEIPFQVEPSSTHSGNDITNNSVGGCASIFYLVLWNYVLVRAEVSQVSDVLLVAFSPSF